jgi:hypothetical protein
MSKKKNISKRGVSGGPLRRTLLHKEEPRIESEKHHYINPTYDIFYWHSSEQCWKRCSKTKYTTDKYKADEKCKQLLDQYPSAIVIRFRSLGSIKERIKNDEIQKDDRGVWESHT